MDEDHFLRLTDLGREVAEATYEKHRFFTEMLVAAGVHPVTAERDAKILDQILSILKNHPEIEKFEIDEEPMVSLPGLEIFPSKRKVFRDRQEIQLTAKEYRILLLLVANKGRVLTYAQIYEQVWGDFTTGNENNTIGFHICNLREKLYRANPDAPFYIRSVREVGYCLDVDEL